MVAVRGGDNLGRGLIILLGPSADLKRRQASVVELRARQRQGHEHPGMSRETLLLKRLCRSARLVRQQLRFDTMNTRRLLQCFDHVREQAVLDVLAIVAVATFADEKISDYALVVLVNEKRIPEDPPTRDRGVPRQKLRVHVPEDHLSRGAVVPAESIRP